MYKEYVVTKHRIISALMELPDDTRIRVVVAYMDGAKARGKTTLSSIQFTVLQICNGDCAC